MTRLCPLSGVEADRQSLVTCQGPTTASILDPALVSFALVECCDLVSEFWCRNPMGCQTRQEDFLCRLTLNIDMYRYIAIYWANIGDCD